VTNFNEPNARQQPMWRLAVHGLPAKHDRMQVASHHHTVSESPCCAHTQAHWCPQQKHTHVDTLTGHVLRTGRNQTDPAGSPCIWQPVHTVTV